MGSFAMDARNTAIFSSVTTRSTVSIPSGMSLNCRGRPCGLWAPRARPLGPDRRRPEKAATESRVGVATDTRRAREAEHAAANTDARTTQIPSPDLGRAFKRRAAAGEVYVAQIGAS